MTDEKSRPALTPDGPTDYTADSIAQEREAWLAEQLEERQRRKKLAAESRAQYAVARQHGLRARHAAKLRRGGGRR